MERIASDYLIYYDTEVVRMINEKYDIPYLEAFKTFIGSKTYEMLENKELEMYEFGFPAIFDMWESEVVTGSPLNSVYLRSEV